jgi:hypothetical protein
LQSVRDVVVEFPRVDQDLLLVALATVLIVGSSAFALVRSIGGFPVDFMILLSRNSVFSSQGIEGKSAAVDVFPLFPKKPDPFFLRELVVVVVPLLGVFAVVLVLLDAVSSTEPDVIAAAESFEGRKRGNGICSNDALYFYSMRYAVSLQKKLGLVRNGSWYFFFLREQRR